MQKAERILWISHPKLAGGVWIKACSTTSRARAESQRATRESEGNQTIILPKGHHPDDPGALDAAAALAMPGHH